MNNKLLIEISANLKNLADNIEIYAKEDKDVLPVTETATPKKEATITLEQVRAALAEKSQSGKQPQVKALIKKHGANKLTELDTSCYAQLLKEAGEL